MSKKIEINGLNNKYMMKKFVLKEEVKELKENHYDFFTDCFDYNIQKDVLLKSYLNDDSNECTILKKELQKKITSYMAQDKKKNRYDNNTFISLNQLLEKLVESQLNCFYCKSNVLLLYKNFREPSQWTLERIDNNIQHDLNNIEICCLKCNLQRRNQNSDAFKLSKQMKIIKKE
uniref:Uncharacterized protein n=1 Tax=viral metagenome TaxID=1070528 RepID=A0A6C0AX45_9ZZZZ|tara:strand:+ start:346 stop:870 length:525 start_codon:yes stop_codon:yes gene_type:complete